MRCVAFAALITVVYSVLSSVMTVDPIYGDNISTVLNVLIIGLFWGSTTPYLVLKSYSANKRSEIELPTFITPHDETDDDILSNKSDVNDDTLSITIMDVESGTVKNPSKIASHKKNKTTDSVNNTNNTNQPSLKQILEDRDLREEFTVFLSLEFCVENIKVIMC